MRNIVILNLSDLHCQNHQSIQTDIFNKFKTKLVEFIRTNPSWQPDFIVIPGDIVNGKDSKKNRAAAYKQVQDWITDICHICNLPPEYVIITCGNHDKDCSVLKKIIDSKEDVERYIKVFNKLDKAIKKETNSLKIVNKTNKKESETDKEQKLKKSFTLSFKAYLKFISPYLNNATESNGKFIPLKSMEKSLKYLTGYKVFEDLKLVFLILNTEWITIRGLNVADPGVMAGHNIIIQLTDEIRKKYPFHTIVGVMHRAPYELKWEEKNTPDIYRLNPYHRLLNTLDILISGHEHAISLTDSPSYFHNQIQHFQLGSFALSPNEGDFFPNSTSLIKIDAINNEAKLIIAQLDTTKALYEWKFQPSSYIYPIPGRFGKQYIHTENETLPIKDSFEYNGIEIIHTKWANSPTDTFNIYKCILNRFYSSKTSLKQIQKGVYSSANGYQLQIKEFDKEADYLNIKSPIPTHLIVYTTRKEDCPELSQQQFKFQSSIHMIKHIFTPILLQKN